MPSNLRIDLFVLPWQWLKLKGFKSEIFEQIFFLILTSEMESTTINLVTLQNFAKFYVQTAEIQPFKVECFSKKMLKVQHVDVSRDFRILFGMWNRLVMGYFYTKFCCDTTVITCDACIFHVCLVVFFYKSTEVSA